jgi:hypothetical protein
LEKISMKKSLIALAALAAVTAASAQSTVTISGTYNLGFQKADSGATKFDLYDANVTFAGVEDLGGGMKASFSVNTQFGGRQDITSTQADATTSTTSNSGALGPNQAKVDGVFGRNVTLSLSGGFGTVSGGRVEGTNTIESAILSGQSLADGFDKAALTGAKSNFNTISYTTPAINGFTASVAQLKSLNDRFAIGATAATTSAGVTTVTAATAAATAETTINVVGASYVNGPLVAGFAYKMVDNVTGIATSQLDGTKTELFATYDLGVAKLGLGYAKNSGDAYAGQKAGVLVSGAIPMGALTLGADYYTRGAGGTTTQALGATYSDGNAYALVAKYELSKRTNLKATIGKLTGDKLVSTQQYRVGMYHAF